LNNGSAYSVTRLSTSLHLRKLSVLRSGRQNKGALRSVLRLRSLALAALSKTTGKLLAEFCYDVAGETQRVVLRVLVECCGLALRHRVPVFV
jgi:hypothetical protein